MNPGRLASFGLGVNDLVEKYMFLFIPASLLLGFLFYRGFAPLTPLVPWLFAYLTFVLGMGCTLGQLGEAVRRPAPMLVLFAAAHLIAPLLAYELGVLLFGPHSPYIIGMVLFAAIPLGVTSAIWIGLAKGAIGFSLAVIVLDSLLSPLVVPLTVDLLFGQRIEFSVLPLMKDLALIIVLPTILGMLINVLSGAKAKAAAAPFTLPTSKAALMIVVAVNAAAIAPHAGKISGDLPRLVAGIILLVSICYALGRIGGIIFRNKELTIALTFSSGMRNISLGLVLGLAYFEPQAIVPIILSILIQQPVATAIHWLFGAFAKKAAEAGSGFG